MATPSRNRNLATTPCGEGALRNLRLGLHPERRLPDRLFSTDRTHFRFFGPDDIFAGDFVGKLGMLLQIEGASCACMANLDVNFGNPQPEAFFLDRLTTPAEYLEQLKGDGRSAGWIHRMDRFGITSEIGGWLIYCEKDNEIAIVAFEGNVKPGQVDQMAAQLDALSVEAAISKPVSIIFASKSLPKAWSDTLIKTYSS
jgi:hypothetical protein